MDQQDLLLAYAIASDAGNFDKIAEIISIAQFDKALEEEIRWVDTTFDSNEEYTRQLLEYRERQKE